MTKTYTNIENLFSKLVPLPLPLGIEINERFLKIVLLKEDSPISATLLDYRIIPRSSQDPAEIIKEMLKEKKLTSVEAKFVVSGSQVDSKRLTLPFIPKEEIPQALRWEAKEHFLLDIEESKIDFEILGEKTDESGSRRLDIIVNIAENNLIEEKLSLIKDTDALPSVIIPAAYSLYNLYRLSGLNRKTSPEEAIALIDIGFSTTTITVIKGEGMRFIRQCGCAGNDFTEAMTGVLVSDKGRIELSGEKAEEVKKDIGIPTESAEETAGEIPTQQVAALVRPVVEKLTSEIQRSFDFYSSQFNEGRVSKIYLTGGTSKLKNIHKELSQRLSLPVEPLDLRNRLKLNIPHEKIKSFKEDFPNIAAPIGAALSDPTRANLLPERYKKERLLRIEKMAARSIFIVLFIAMLGLYLFEIGHERTLRNLLAAKKGQYQKLEEAQALRSKLDQKNAIIKHALENQPPFYYVFKELTSITPDEIYLKNMILTDKASKLTVEGVVLHAKEAEEAILAKFLKRLEDSPFFSDVYLISSQDIEIEGKTGLEFEINCKLRQR